MTPPPVRRRAAPDRAADLTADLLADLSAPSAVPSAPPPVAATSATMPGATPVLSLTLTPLHWRAPAFAPAERGVGVAVRVGPLRIEVAF